MNCLPILVVHYLWLTLTDIHIQKICYDSIRENDIAVAIMIIRNDYHSQSIYKVTVQMLAYIWEDCPLDRLCK